MVAAKRGKKKKGGISVSFDGVEAGGRSLADGTYLFEVDGVPTLETSAESGNEYIKWVFKVAEGKGKGAKVWHNTSLQPPALWNLRGLLEAMGIDIPEGDMDLELEEFEGVTVGGVVVNEDYQGKPRPRISEFLTADDALDEDEDDEEEEPAPPKKSTTSKGKGKTQPSKEEDDEDEDEDEDDEEEAPPKKSSSKGKPKAKPPAKDEDEDEDEDEDDEEEAPPPKKRGRPAKKPLFKVGQKVQFPDDEDEDEFLVGKITEIGDDVATVKVGKDLFEVELTELQEA